MTRRRDARRVSGGARPMKPPHALLASFLVFACACASDAAPAPPAPPQEAPQPAPEQTPPKDAPQQDAAGKPAPAPGGAPADDADAKARAILAKAAALQCAGGLAEPGKLDSFHVVFRKATFEREDTRPDG